MRTRLFLRTAEFLWQEGHTVHATADEAMEETRRMLEVYAEFAEKQMAMPVIRGEKTAGERFPGAVTTLSIEAMMQDRKALQAGTSHFLGQNFSRAQEIKFQDQNGQIEFAWTTSWGVSTRLIGALIMTHSDDDGFVLPPRLAPTHAVIMPIYRDDTQRAAVLEYCKTLRAELISQSYAEQRVRVDIDDRDLRGGEKKWYHVKRGVPLRIEVGPKDIANGAAFVARRDSNTSQSMPRNQLVAEISSLLESIQSTLYERALAMRTANTVELRSEAEFRDYFQPDDELGNSTGGGFAKCWFESEAAVKPLLDELKVTIRCIPLDAPQSSGNCFLTGKTSNTQAIFAKAY
jgi:prolyl-tRNA synthetase